MQAEKCDSEAEKGTGKDKVDSVANKVKDLKVEDGKDAAAPPASPNSSGSASPFVTTFKAFSKFGDTKSDGKQITLSQSDKWMKQAKVIDGKKITTTDTGIFFKKQKSMKLGLKQYEAFLDELAKNKKIELSEIKNKLANCGTPGTTGSSAAASARVSSAVDRLTDVSKYTGSHKQRFDEAGKGKGMAGRKDVQEASGYVQGYQHKDTYKGQ